MKITLNGQSKEFSKSITLKNIIEQFCKDTHHVIAEVNGTIVKSPQWAEEILNEGDTVELVNFVGGG
jgi:thiamine biosynthesis protein ThiS